MSRYFILEGKIRLMQKTGKKKELKIVINDPPKPFALFDSKKRLLTLKAENTTQARQIDELGRLFGRKKDREGERIRFDHLNFGVISVKRYRYAHRNQEVKVDERLLPTDVRGYVDKSRKTYSRIEIDVLRFIGGRLQT